MSASEKNVMKTVILTNQARSMAIFWRVLIGRMRSQGMDITCLVPPGDLISERDLREMGARVINYPLDRKGLNPIRDIKTFLALRNIFQAEKPDLLFTATIKPVIYGCLAAYMAKVPGIYAAITGLGYAFEANTFFKKIINRVGAGLYSAALRHATAVFFQNKDDEHVFQAQGILERNAKVFFSRGTGVDIKHFSPAPFPPLPPDGPVIFLLVARLLEAKGLAEYALAAKILHEKFPDARFQLLGPPEQGRGAVAMADVEKWDKAGHIEYLGQSKDVRPCIAASHAAVLPSWREGTPTSLMEAMSMGRPCVATDVPGCREVVREGENGWLAKRGDPRSLAMCMEKFLQDPASIASMGAASRKMAIDDFDAVKVAEGIIRDMRETYPDKSRWPAPSGELPNGDNND